MNLTFSQQTYVEFKLSVPDAYALLDGDPNLVGQLREQIRAHEATSVQLIPVKPENGNHRTPRAKRSGPRPFARKGAKHYQMNPCPECGAVRHNASSTCSRKPKRQTEPTE